MALDLDNDKAIDYASETPLLPFDCTGEYDPCSSLRYFSLPLIP